MGPVLEDTENGCDAVGDTISSAMLLNNFLVARRDNYDASYFKTFSQQNVSEESGSCDVDDVCPLVSDNNERNPGGRPSADAARSKDKGDERRKHLSNALQFK